MRKVLVVEDDQAMAIALRDGFEYEGYAVTVALPKDPGQAGKAQVLYLTRALMHSTVISSIETGDKGTRAAPFASQANVGNMTLVRAPWNRPLLDELASFPGGVHDDQVDACSRAFSNLDRCGYDLIAAVGGNAEGWP